MPRGKHRRPWYRSVKLPEPKPESRRRSAQRDLRRQKRLDVGRTAGQWLVAVAVVVGLGAGIWALVSGGDDGAGPPVAQPSAGEAPDDTIDTTLLVGTKESGTNAGAMWLTLLSIDRASGRGAVIYVPAHTATEVPGRGLLGVGEALDSGGMPLLLVAVENLLGVQVDRYVELSDSDARVLFQATGDITVDVPTEVHVKAGVNQTRLLFPEGPQLLPPRFLEFLLYIGGVDGDETDLGSRHLAFWDAVFEQFSETPDELRGAIVQAAPALAESDAEVEEIATFFEKLLEVPDEDRSLVTLPVRQVSVGGDELYEVDTEQLAAFMEDTLGSKPRVGDEIRVQILNGNGVPGIGEEVAEKLSEENFRVILSGNARRLDYEKTLVVTYDSSVEGQAIAKRARDLIGVGEVQVSAQGQGIVDLTIVVGKDFLETQ